MMTGSIGRRLLRFAGVLALAGFTVGCAGPQHGPTVSPAGFGNDPVARAERLVSYCERLDAKGESVTALGLCARAYEINPDAPEPLMKIASILRAMNRKEAATETYEALLQRHPGHNEARYSLGKVYMETGATEMAALHFNHAIRNNPEDPRPYNALGILRDQAGEHQTAQALYRTALERDPGNFSARNNLGLSLAMTGQRDEAIEVLAELSVDPLAGQTVMRNLEAAYASRALLAPEQAVNSPAPSGAPKPGKAASVPVMPVETEVLVAPAAAPVAIQPPAAEALPGPAEPSQGAPTPLFMPQPSTAGEPLQSGALRAEPSSVILAAAERLMTPPDWADFEPGALIENRAPSEASNHSEALLQNHEVGDVSANEVDAGDLSRYSLSMLMVDSLGTTA